MRSPSSSDRIDRFLLVLLAILIIAVSASFVMAAGPRVSLRSGVVLPEEAGEGSADPELSGPERWIVRFHGPTGTLDRGLLEASGARVEAPLPGQAYLVSVPSGRGAGLAALSGVDWATPYRPASKISPEVSRVGADSDEAGDVIVLLHLFADSDPELVADELAAQGLRVEGAGRGSRFGRIVLRMRSQEVAERRLALAERSEVFWIERRHRRVLTDDSSTWVGQSGLNGGQRTPVFDNGIYGEGQIAAVLDTGLDVDMCFFRDEALGLPPVNEGTGGTTVDLGQRKVIAVDFLDPAEDSLDPTHWDTQNHGTHVAGILAGDDLANPLLHDFGDGMAPGAKLVIQDAGYAADDCGDLPALGCPVTDLTPIFQQAYDQGARVHNNSWNDNENALVQNRYTDASQDVDEFIWANPDFLILFGAGNQGYPAGNPGKIGSPGTAKNGMSIGATYYGEYADNLADISSWGPTDDGRIKPDVLFPGQSIHSAGNDGDVTTENCGAVQMGGTSMASPGAAGNALLVREYFMDGRYPSGTPTPADELTPTAALVKAMLVNSAVPIKWDNGGNAITIPSDPQGWGRILLDDALYFPGDRRRLWVDEHSDGFTGPGDPEVVYQLELLDPSEPLKVTLAWTDYPSTPAASTHLVNDLDLRVDGASGTLKGNNFNQNASWQYGDFDRLNNLEQVLVPAPEPGMYTIRISPHAVPSGPQPWALVVTGGEMVLSAGPVPSYVSHAIDDSGPNGNGNGVLDPGETARIPVTLWNAGDAAATSVVGRLYSSHPGLLTVHQGESSYPDMAVGAQGSSQSPHYEVTLQPGASCGQILGTTLSVSGDGFQTGSAFTIPIGLFEAGLPSTDTPVTIPRDGEANSYLSVADSFPFEEVDVEVHIAHDDISELEVLVFSPGAAPVYLHNESGAGVSGIHTIYDEQTEPDGPGTMDDYIGRESQGTWRLKINDLIRGTGGGDLESWTLHFKSKVPFGCQPVSCGEAVPPAVRDTLMVTEPSASNLELEWTGVGGASEYNLWRSLDPRLQKATLAGTTSGTTLTDSGANATLESYFYVVRSVNSCNWESP